MQHNEIGATMKRTLWTALVVLGLLVTGLFAGQGALATPHVKAAAADPGVSGLITDAVTGQAQVVTNFKNGSYSSALPCGLDHCDALWVGTPSFTGVYHRTVGPGSQVHYTPVYLRPWRACRNWTGGIGRACMSGTIVYANYYAACFNGCTVAGLRGSQGCGQDVIQLGASITVTECRNHLALTGTHAYEASVAYNTYFVGLPGPLPLGWSSTWHINAYSNGGITGPYSGYGVA